ncbi:IPExxxVDY family protein [Psychroflexus salinarum]|uniref:IPExxxVDY family protein n=1 Tax=Psychroflexus salinarum TaxID=546024 RepID=A0ABW3GP29_9FLAO
MKKKKFSLSDFEICDFKLIGIHSQQEPHKLAYLINTALNANFKRMENDLDIKIKGRLIGFPVFDYYNMEWDTKSHLICNRVSIEQELVAAENLFGTEDFIKTEFLLKDYKRVDYLLKIEDELDIFNPQLVIQRLTKMHQISMVYTIDSDAIKHPENLILD